MATSSIEVSDSNAPMRHGVVQWRAAIACILVLSAVIYIPSLHGSPTLDDNDLLHGAGVRATRATDCFTKPYIGLYFRPLTALSFYIQNRLAGDDTFSYHLFNVAIHALTTWALIGMLLAAFNSRRIALLGGALFAVQPDQVDTVAWIAGRLDCQCSLLLVLFTWALIAAVRASGRRRALLLWASAGSFLLACLTMEQALAALPLVPLGFSAFGLRDRDHVARRRSWRDALRLALDYLPFVLAAGAFLVMYAIWPSAHTQRTRAVGTQLALGGRTVLYYAQLLFVPTPHSMFAETLNEFEALGIWAAVAGLAVAAGSVILFVRWRRSSPVAAWFLAMAVLLLFPVSNLLPISPWIVLPWRAGTVGISAAALLAWWLAGTWRTASWRPAVCAAYLIGSTGLSIWGATQWTDLLTLRSTFARFDPGAYTARTDVTGAYYKAGRYTEALTNAEDVFTRLFRGSAWREPESARHAYDTDASLREYMEFLVPEKGEPSLWISKQYIQLGFVRLGCHDFNGARTAFQCALAFQPSNAQAYLGLGDCAIYSDDPNGAVTYLRKSEEIYGALPETHSALGQVLAHLNRPAEAIPELQMALKMQPGILPVYQSLAGCQRLMGDLAGAEDTLRAALPYAGPNADEVNRLISMLESERQTQSGSPFGSGLR